MKHFRQQLTALACLLAWFADAPSTLHAEDRTLTDAQRQAIENQGELAEQPDRPARLPDLTKGDAIGKRLPQNSWHLGPTGIIGYMPGGLKGDQIEVESILKGAPAEGKLQWGDVIIGVSGKRFAAGGNMGQILGDAIIEAELEKNQGKLTLDVWRDNNFIPRNGKKDIRNTDVDDLITKAGSDDALYEWKSETEKKDAVRSSNFKEFPIDAQVLQITLTLDVLPPYSDTSPYDCPKAKYIREVAWKVLEKRFKENRVRANRLGTVQALALVASGKPEHRELIRQWVRSPQAKAWHPSVAGSIDMMKSRGYYSWFMSFDALDCAIYYDATGDDFVLPALTEYAVKTAMGQAGGGSWGHTFAWPVFNGGKLHGMNPGYGALNAAGNRCFMLIALAQKLGIEHPEIDQAVKRSQRFFGSYVDKGAIPYGHHGAAATDDSNGKNVGVAFALKFLGDKYGSKYFAAMSTHASFTRRGGHGNDYFWHYSPWAATLLGPKGTIATHRNLRWRFTLARRFDGAFVIQSPTGGIESLRDPTATYALHYSAPLKQTLWTGKDADESMFWTDEEFHQLMSSARGQFFYDHLNQLDGTPWRERDTDEVFRMLNLFKPKARRQAADLLAKRYKAGEKDILPRLAKLLTSDDPRFRDGACRGLMSCGPDATLQYMSGVARLLDDEYEFVRMRAISTMAKASQDADTQLALLRTTVEEDPQASMSPNSALAVAQGALFRTDTKLAKTPFDAGLDEEIVRDALEKLITLDPAGNRSMMSARHKDWTRDTVVRVAGPIMFTAEQEQIADQMFSSRRRVAISLLDRLGYHEVIDGSVSYLRRYDQLPRDLRPRVFFKRGNVDAKTLMKYPAAAREHLDALKRWMLDKPLALAFAGKDEPSIWLHQLIDAIEASKPGKAMPRLEDQVSDYFQGQLAKLPSATDKLAYCRAELANIDSKAYFRKLAAMGHLVETLGHEAMADLLPYVGHEHWRLGQRSQQLMMGLVRDHGDTALIDAFSSADTPTQVGILQVLARTQSAKAKQLATQAIEHDLPVVRAAGVRALFAIAGDSAIDTIFALMNRDDSDVVLRACEDVLLSERGELRYDAQVRRAAIAMLPKAADNPMLRESLYWLIAQCPDSESLDVLRQATQTRDEREFQDVVNAVAYCPAPEADELLIEVIKRDPKSKRAKLAAAKGMRRMLIGPDGLCTRSTKHQLDYAQQVLSMVLDKGTITYLGRIKTGRSAYILQQTMRRGEPETAAKAIIDATSDLSDAPTNDRKLATAALIDTIEFIEVNYLRGGASKQDWRTYPMWKTISAQAGKNLLKLDKPADEPLPEFDDMDLGL